MMLIIMLQSVNFLNTRVVGKTPQRPAQPDPDEDGNPQPQLPGPALNVEITIPLKYLSNFWRSLDLQLTNC